MTLDNLVGRTLERIASARDLRGEVRASLKRHHPALAGEWQRPSR